MGIDWRGKAANLKLQIRNFIGGRWLEPAGEPLDKYSSRDGTLLYRFGAGQEEEVDLAVESARQSYQNGAWSNLPVQCRKDVLHKLADLIEQHQEEIALLECLDVGKPIADAFEFDVPTAAATVRFAAEAADKLYGNVYAADHSSLSYQLIRPIGVVAGVIGWNFPLLLAAGKLGPALAMGNSLVLKPSELTSLSAGRLAELAVEAGVPPGVFNVIHGGPAVGAALAEHPDVNLLSFTGSTRTGKKMLIAAGQSNMKRLILECGGKAPNIVFDDCPNLDAVADAVLVRAFWNQGQVCTASSRLLVQAGVREQLLSMIEGRARAIVPRDPLDAATKHGAVVSQQHKRRILDYIASGKRDGARVRYQSNATFPNEKGFYVSPLIFDRVSVNYKIAQEEIFGPILSVLEFRDEKEAIQIANQSIYGLSAMLWTKDVGRAHRVTHALNVGWIVVNSTDKPAGGPGVGVLSVGGHKESGIGSEGGIEGVEHYATKTAVQIFV